jgi:hypothetical protein
MSKNFGLVISVVRVLEELILNVPKFTKPAPSESSKSLEESLILETIQSIDEKSNDCLRDVQLRQTQHEHTNASDDTF